MAPVASGLQRDLERHRPDRFAVGRQPERVGDEESLADLELHDRPAEYAAQAPEHLVAEVGRLPLDRVRTEHPRRGDRVRDLPPGVERVGIEERLQHAPRRRRDDRGHVETRERGYRVCFTAETAKSAEPK